MLLPPIYEGGTQGNGFGETHQVQNKFQHEIGKYLIVVLQDAEGNLSLCQADEAFKLRSFRKIQPTDALSIDVPVGAVSAAEMGADCGTRD
jgi:hypothetical protein